MELSILVFLPIVAATAVLALPRRYEQQAKYVALIDAIATKTPSTDDDSTSRQA